MQGGVAEEEGGVAEEGGYRPQRRGYWRRSGETGRGTLACAAWAEAAKVLRSVKRSRAEPTSIVTGMKTSLAPGVVGSR